MLETISKLAGRVADYTLGTVIVVVQVTMADRRARLQLPAPAAPAAPSAPPPRTFRA